MDNQLLRVGGMSMAISLLCVTTCFAQQAKGGGDMKEAQTVRSATKMLVMADFFRTHAMTNSAVTVSRMSTEACAKKWADEIVSKVGEKREMVFADFFAGAVVYMGALTTEKSVVGFYNPWTDAILLGALRVQGDSPAVMEDFIFVTGESFRGAPLQKGEMLLALYRPEKPLMIELATRVAKTKSLFEKRYPLHGESPLLAPDLKACMQPQEVEWAYILARQAYRMNMFAALTEQENRTLYLQIGKLLTALDHDMKDLGKAVSAQQRPAALDNIKLLPAELRKNLAPHYIVQAQNGAIVGFVNPEFPRWVVIANLKGAPKSEQEATLEAFDLETSNSVLDLMKGNK